MKKYFFGLLAIGLAVGAVAFTKPAVRKAKLTDHYFQFVGTPNQDEGDVTKWNEVSASTYDGIPCTATHLGCKLITSNVQTISSQVRPDHVPLLTGTNDPTTDADVSEVKNLQ
jgi:hypothetical protein